jgi:anti-anti-sigma factor
MSSRFAVLTERDHERVIVRLLGELDFATADDLAAVVRQGCPGRSELVLDLSGLNFVDCAGLRVLLYARARARRDGFRLLLIRGPEIVQRVCRLTGVEALLPFSERRRSVADGNCATARSGRYVE